MKVKGRMLAGLIVLAVALLVTACAPEDFPFDVEDCWRSTVETGYTCDTPPEGTLGWTENSNGTWIWLDYAGPNVTNEEPCFASPVYLYYRGVYKHGSCEGPPYTGIFLLAAEQQAMYVSVPNAAGATPCGVFDVNGWGAKYVGLGDFPGCTAPVTVMCYNDAGEWTASEVNNIVMHGDYEVDFTSSQHGICGLFAQ